MILERDPEDRHAVHGVCDRCGKRFDAYLSGGVDIDCEHCGAIYNCFGQRLRDDLYSRPNPSEWDDDIDDLTGYEIAMGYDN